MKSQEKQVLLWVHPSFKARIKSESALQGMSIINYTKELSHSKSLMEEFNESQVKDFRHQRPKKFNFI